MQSFPTTDPAKVLVYQHVSPEGQRIPVLSDEQQAVAAAIKAGQAAAAADPALNGQNARLPHSLGLGFTDSGYSSRPYNWRAPGGRP